MSPIARDPSSPRSHRESITARNDATAIRPGPRLAGPAGLTRPGCPASASTRRDQYMHADEIKIVNISTSNSVSRSFPNRLSHRS